MVTPGWLDDMGGAGVAETTEMLVFPAAVGYDDAASDDRKVAWPAEPIKRRTRFKK
jgi:hypothetical protein